MWEEALQRTGEMQREKEGEDEQKVELSKNQQSNGEEKEQRVGWGCRVLSCFISGVLQLPLSRCQGCVRNFRSAWGLNHTCAARFGGGEFTWRPPDTSPSSLPAPGRCSGAGSEVPPSIRR